MANINSDVIRLESTEAGLTGILRAGSDGYASDSRKLLRKFADGNYYRWTPDELFSVGASGVNYTNSLRPTLTNVEQALDVALAAGDYFADIGVTGVPYWGDGILEAYVTRQGSAVYSSDGHVYFMSEAGFTGTTTLLGCRFVVTPVPQGDRIYFSNGAGTAASEYSYIGYTGLVSGASAELMVFARNGGSSANIVLKANYGKIKLTTSSVGSGNDGIVLVGKDDAGVAYDAAASSNYRALYADTDGEVVVATSDQAVKYKEGGFTGMSTDTSPVTFNYVSYVVNGKMVSLHIPEITGWCANYGYSLQGLPAEIRAPAAGSRKMVQAFMYYEMSAPGSVRILAEAEIREDGTIIFQPYVYNGITGLQVATIDEATGVIGLPQQCITYNTF